ncbi:MAG: caspase family protein [Hyphomicrobiaceae bacterium]
MPGKRIALVIGNSAYSDAPLRNATRDAEAVAQVLDQIGFSSVQLLSDLKRSDLAGALADFGEEAAHADIAVIFYAGHAMEYDGETYLLPVDKLPSHVRRIKFETQRLTDLVSAVGGARSLGLVLLDACRNASFRSRIEGIGAVRSGMHGLAAIQPTGNVLVGYAAKHGTVALDGTYTPHSPFTAGLLRFLATPSLDVRILFGKIRDAVLERTHGAQEPHLYGSLGGREVYLAGEADDAVAPNVFVSYSKGDRARVEPLATALRGRGWNVFWDAKLEVGKEWRPVIEQRLKMADCVLAVWSRNSVHSDWVKYEVSRATQKGILVPVTIDGTPPPRIFDGVQTADLKDWVGDPDDPRLVTVLRAVEQILDRQAAEMQQALSGAPRTAAGAQPPQPGRGRGASLATTAMVVALASSTLVLGGMAWNALTRRPQPAPVPVPVALTGKEPSIPAPPVVAPPVPKPEDPPPKTVDTKLPVGPWFPLLGSYRTPEYADREVADLSQKAGAHLKGRNIVINARRVRGQLFHGVMIEPSTTRDEVDRLCAALRDLGFQCSPVDSKDGS